ncbi:MAG TPA: hypothetical protein VHV82_12665 [Sporichthyaceae bacterium]|jgi:hypothetical protein|nr:hypothetical protein [Sporichthyaceae bacterium]
MGRQAKVIGAVRGDVLAALSRGSLASALGAAVVLTVPAASDATRVDQAHGPAPAAAHGAIQHDAAVLQRVLGTDFKIEPYGQGYLRQHSRSAAGLPDRYTVGASIVATAFSVPAMPSLCDKMSAMQPVGGCVPRKLPDGRVVEVQDNPRSRDGGLPTDAGVQAVQVFHQRADDVLVQVSLAAVAIRGTITPADQARLATWLDGYVDRLATAATDPTVAPSIDSRGGEVSTSRVVPPVPHPPGRHNPEGLAANAADMQAALGPDFTFPPNNETGTLRPGSPSAAGLPPSVQVSVTLNPLVAQNGMSVADRCAAIGIGAPGNRYCRGHRLPDGRIVQYQGGGGELRVYFLQPTGLLAELDMTADDPTCRRRIPGPAICDSVAVQRWFAGYLDNLGVIATAHRLSPEGAATRMVSTG